MNIVILFNDYQLSIGVVEINFCKRIFYSHFILIVVMRGMQK